MRIALCLSGQFRTGRQCLPSIKKYLITPLNTDIFFHTWRTSSLEYSDQYNKSRPLYKEIDKEELTFIKNTLLPIDFIVEEDRWFDYSYYENEHARFASHPQSILSMFYSISRADLLRQHWEKLNGFTYDFVIRCRFDLEFSKELNSTWFQDHITSPQAGCTDELMHDIFAIANSANMSIYSSCFWRIKELFDSLRIEINPGRLLAALLKANNINKVYLPLDAVIIR